MFSLSIERVWKPNHAKPAQANDTIILRGHISTKVRIPGTGYLLCAGKLEQIIYLVYMWLREQSDVGEVHPNALCGITVAVLWLSACVLSATPDTPLRCSSLPSTHHHTALPWRSGRAGEKRQRLVLLEHFWIFFCVRCLQLPLSNHKAEVFFKRKAGVVEYFSPLREWQHPVALYVSVSLKDCFNLPFFPRFSPSTFFLEFFLTSLQRSLGKVGRFFSALSSACKVNRREHVLKQFPVPRCFASLASLQPPRVPACHYVRCPACTPASPCV